MKGLPWIRLNTDVREHPKAYRLADITGDRRAWTYVVELWMWAGENALDGDLSRLPDSGIARAAGFEGKPQDCRVFVQALRDAGFIDPDSRIHDWEEHQGAHVKKFIADRAKPDGRRKPGEATPPPRKRAAKAVTLPTESPATPDDIPRGISGGYPGDTRGILAKPDEIPIGYVDGDVYGDEIEEHTHEASDPSAPGVPSDPPGVCDPPPAVEGPVASGSTALALALADARPAAPPRPVLRVVRQPPPESVVVAVFDAADAFLRPPDAKPLARSADRAELVADRLADGCDPASLVQAVEGFPGSPWGRAEGRPHLSLEYILGSVTQVEKGVRLRLSTDWRDPRPRAARPRVQTSARAPDAVATSGPRPLGELLAGIRPAFAGDSPGNRQEQARADSPPLDDAARIEARRVELRRQVEQLQAREREGGAS